MLQIKEDGSFPSSFFVKGAFYGISADDGEGNPVLV